ncbi:MAG TPA: Lsr2 family protein [Jiangellaceae bacterium]|jgi:Lsr2|nr:Lsr2 family protein [Jiangellaceae bacterium]
MAQKVQVILVDDIDGGKAEETVSFSLDGVSYELDLSKKNAAKFRDSLAQYVGSARKTARRGRARGQARGGRGSNTAAIRQWARDQGMKVSDRGRVPAEILAKYDAAHG